MDAYSVVLSQGGLALKAENKNWRVFKTFADKDNRNQQHSRFLIMRRALRPSVFLRAGRQARLYSGAIMISDLREVSWPFFVPGSKKGSFLKALTIEWS